MLAWRLPRLIAITDYVMKKIIFIFAAALLASQCFAQQNNDRKNRKKKNPRAPSLSIGTQLADPQGQFGFQYEGYPIGLAGQVLLNSGQGPFDFGVAAAWQAMGSNKREIDIFQGEDIQGDDIWSKGTMSVRNNSYLYHGVARLKPFNGAFQMYGDLLGGLKSFSTKTVIEKDNGGYTEVIDSRRDHRDFAISYGWASGIKIRLLDGMMLECRFEKLLGGQTTFIDPNSIVIDENGGLTYEEIETKTNVMNYQLGVSFEF